MHLERFSTILLCGGCYRQRQLLNGNMQCRCQMVFVGGKLKIHPARERFWSHPAFCLVVALLFMAILHTGFRGFWQFGRAPPLATGLSGPQPSTTPKTWVAPPGFSFKTHTHTHPHTHTCTTGINQRRAQKLSRQRIAVRARSELHPTNQGSRKFRPPA